MRRLLLRYGGILMNGFAKMSRILRRTVALAFAAGLTLAMMGGCRRVASTEQCEAASRRVAELRVKHEKTHPLGKLRSPPFNGPQEERTVFDETQSMVRARCVKGWKSALYDCMMAAASYEDAEKCLVKNAS